MVDAFTENIDLMPTMLDWLGLDIPLQCDGYSLAPFLAGVTRPVGWREGAHHEFDWRHWPVAPGRWLDQQQTDGWQAGRSMDAQCLCVLRDECATYVQFADGTAFSIEGSANLCGNGSGREQFALFADADLTDWHAAWIDELVTRHEGREE